MQHNTPTQSKDISNNDENIFGMIRDVSKKRHQLCRLAKNKHTKQNYSIIKTRQPNAVTCALILDLNSKEMTTNWNIRQNHLF